MNRVNANNKTPSYWFAVNQNVRDDPNMKEALNNNETIQAALGEQMDILEAVATKLGFSLETIGADRAQIEESPFPIPYINWSGVMPFDTGETDGEDHFVYDHKGAFAKAGTVIRRETVRVRLAVKMIKDATKFGEEGDPGGAPSDG